MRVALTIPKKITFYHFMMENFNKEDSPKGDLARDMADDRNFPKRSGNYQRIKDYLVRSGACDECLGAFDDGWNEYKQWKETEKN